MTALTSDILVARRRAVITQSSDSAIRTRFPGARDGLKSPSAGYFDSATDAQTALDARFALIGVVRRRFAVRVADLVVPSLASGVPCYRLTDSEQGVDAVHLVARIEVDLENETTGLELLG